MEQQSKFGTPQNKITLTRPLVYVDTEWTDLDPDRRRIVSIAATRFNPDGSFYSRYWLVNPKRKISSDSSEIHGIFQEHVANQPVFGDIAEEVKPESTDATLRCWSDEG